MGIEVKSNSYMVDTLKLNKTKTDAAEFKEEVLNDINGTADDAYNQMLAKKAEYEAAKGIFNNLSQKKVTAYKKYQSAQLSNKNGSSTSLLSETRSSYDSVLSQFSDASINVDVLRSSLQDSIFYSGKMNNSAGIANSVLG